MHESIKDKVEGLLVKCAEAIKVCRDGLDAAALHSRRADNCHRPARKQIGSPLSPDTWQGPQVSETQFNRIMEHIRVGRDEDRARVLTGGERHGSKGYFIKPTIFTDVKPGQCRATWTSCVGVERREPAR